VYISWLPVVDDDDDEDEEEDEDDEEEDEEDEDDEEEDDVEVVMRQLSIENEPVQLMVALVMVLLIPAH